MGIAAPADAAWSCSVLLGQHVSEDGLRAGWTRAGPDVLGWAGAWIRRSAGIRVSGQEAPAGRRRGSGSRKRRNQKKPCLALTGPVGPVVRTRGGRVSCLGNCSGNISHLALNRWLISPSLSFISESRSLGNSHAIDSTVPVAKSYHFFILSSAGRRATVREFLPAGPPPRPPLPAPLFGPRDTLGEAGEDAADIPGP